MAKIDVLRAEAKEAASAILHETTKAYFEKHGSIVEQIFWHQYTPWFNDGDTCEFSVCDPNVVLYADTNEEKYEEGSMYCSDLAEYEANLAKWAEFKADPEAYKDKINAEYSGKYFNVWNTRDNYKPHYISEQDLLERIEQYKSYPKDFIKDTDALLNMIYKIDDSIKEELFGNHITVRMTANGIETEEYNHD
jgi:hypothetical protein